MLPHFFLNHPIATGSRRHSTLHSAEANRLRQVRTRTLFETAPRRLDFGVTPAATTSIAAQEGAAETAHGSFWRTVLAGPEFRSAKMICGVAAIYFALTSLGAPALILLTPS